MAGGSLISGTAIIRTEAVQGRCILKSPVSGNTPRSTRLEPAETQEIAHRSEAGVIPPDVGRPRSQEKSPVSNSRYNSNTQERRQIGSIFAFWTMTEGETTVTGRSFILGAITSFAVLE